MIKYICDRNIYVHIGNDLYILLEKGFAWDGATVVKDICSTASGVHDKLYRKRGHITVYHIIDGKMISEKKVKYSKFKCDKIYRELLEFQIIGFVRQFGLFIFGWKNWITDKDNLINVTLNYGNFHTHYCSHNIKCYVSNEYGSFVPARFSYIKI